MKRILFVDDEPLVLQGLQRVLRAESGEWKMEFVETGAEALARMALAPFDVVVSDMRMPGMNGAELLNQVMKLYPKTVRLILSGYADRGMILKCIGSTHQYLSKPCEPADLRAAVQRAARLETTLQSECIKLLVHQIKQLPCLPALYLEIVKLLHHPDSTMEDVGELIAPDLELTAKIVKFANSFTQWPRQPVETVTEAAMLLGLDVIRALVLSIGVFSQYDQVKLGHLTAESVWSHSRRVAGLARQIARLETDDLKLIDEAFVAGMLHDLGKLVIAGKLPDEYKKVMQVAADDRLEFHLAEEQVLGANHADAGGYLLGLWGLSVPIVEAIAFHHQPKQGTQTAFTPLTAVHVADALSHEVPSPNSPLTAAQIDSEYLASLGLTERAEHWRRVVARKQP